VIVEGDGAVLGVNLGRPIVTSGAFAKRSSQITLRTCCNFLSMYATILKLRIHDTTRLYNGFYRVNGV